MVEVGGGGVIVPSDTEVLGNFLLVVYSGQRVVLGVVWWVFPGN